MCFLKRKTNPGSKLASFCLQRHALLNLTSVHICSVKQEVLLLYIFETSKDAIRN